MKKIILIAGYLFIYFSGYSQISEGGMPRSFDLENAANAIAEVSFQSPYDIYSKSEDINDKFYYRIGISIPASINVLNEATVETIENGGKLYRLKIISDGALALGLYYDNYYIAEGAELYIYSEDKSQVIGKFTNMNNPESNFFATELIHGDRLIIEYYEPQNTKSQSFINISEIAYIYRGFKNPTAKNTSNYGDSEYCEVNVNCSPEGNNWQDEKRGVAKILLKEGSSYFWCTGSLVNNARQNFDPYFLTADHCGDNASTNDYLQWIFYFNFETPGCTNPSTTPSSNTITGCSKVASGGNSGSTGSDFKLLLFNSNVPASYNLFFNGWNRLNSTSSSGVGIHHPSGDVKKISTFNSNLITASWSGTYNAHWLVYWISTLNGHGITEGGSSGSPLFNPQGLIVGTLTGGGSYCSSPNSPDLYGKFSYSWESNGTAASERLKNWLDPDNTGLTTLNGIEHEVLIAGLQSQYCLNDSPDTLSGIPSTGTFSGPGITGNVFTPSNAGPGTFTITYSTTAGNTSLQVTVNPLPLVGLGSDIQLPVGQTANIDAGTGFASYLWSDGSSLQSINVSTGGTYWVEVSDNQGCVAYDTITVTEIPAQTPGWTYFNTGSNHSILIQGTIPVLINGVQIEPGDYIGVFYDSLGILTCGGYMIWTGNSEALAAWGAQSGLNDGFAAGEEFKFRIWDSSANVEYQASATFIQSGFPHHQFYTTNGMSGLASLTTINTEIQTLTLNQGWGIFSTYIHPTETLLDSIFSPVISSVIIIKDGTGTVFWPPFINMIGNITDGKGYQINMSAATNLQVEGTAIVPQVTNITVPSGWSIIGYLRQSPGNLETMLGSLSGKIVIVKNSSGLVYWPPFVNLIGNMIPGQGYQVNLNSAGVLTYPAN